MLSSLFCFLNFPTPSSLSACLDPSIYLFIYLFIYLSIYLFLFLFCLGFLLRTLALHTAVGEGEDLRYSSLLLSVVDV